MADQLLGSMEEDYSSKEFCCEGKELPGMGHRLEGVLSGEKNIWTTTETTEQLS